MSEVQRRITLLGTGSSGGVPRTGGDWGACDPDNPKNFRTRCCLLVEQQAAGGAWGPEETTSVLIDTSPDLRFQLLAAETKRIDAVLYTHDHADQTHGLDDLRVFALTQRRRVPVYMDKATSQTLMARFSYAFVQPEGSLYPPILDAKMMPSCGTPFSVDGPGGAAPFIPLDQDHGRIRSLGFRIGDMAYSNDLVDMPEESFAALENLDVWIVDALRYTPHKTHTHLAKTLSWIERLKPKRAILTNMHIDMDYETLCKELPDGVEPGYDGMRVIG